LTLFITTATELVALARAFERLCEQRRVPASEVLAVYGDPLLTTMMHEVVTLLEVDHQPDEADIIRAAGRLNDLLTSEVVAQLAPTPLEDPWNDDLPTSD